MSTDAANDAFAYTYASRSKRLIATFIDSSVILVAFLFLSAVTTVLYSAFSVSPSPWEYLAEMKIYTLLFLLMHTAYYVGLESSHFRATFGKRALRIQVTTKSGKAVSISRASAHQVARLFILFATMGLGYFVLLLTSDKQGLYDKLASVIAINEPDRNG